MILLDNTSFFYIMQFGKDSNFDHFVPMELQREVEAAKQREVEAAKP